MKKTLLLIFIVALLATTTVYADFTSSKWMYSKEIVGISPVRSGSYVKVHLDREVSFHANADLSDLRVLENGVETPYQLVTLSPEVRGDYIQSSLSDLSSRDEMSMFVIDLGQSGVLNDHLRIETESKNFKRGVSVYASDTRLPIDDSNWRLLTANGYIYNFHDDKSGFDAGGGEVEYGDNTSRYLKVVIGAGEGGNVLVRGASVFRLSTRDSVENIFRQTATVVDNAAKKTTEITVDLGGVGIPTHRLTLETADTKNFSRRALVLESNDGVNWSSVGDGYLFSLRTPLFSGRALTLPFRETRSRYLRVLIMNQDDLPVRWGERVEIQSTVRAVVFLTSAGKKYSLLYGNSTAVQPSYDLARYFQYIESTSLIRATLAAEIPNSDYQLPVAKAVPYSENHPNLLNIVLVMLVAVLSFFLLSYLKKLKHSPRGENRE